jgi:DNA polymerase-3 subunit delta
VASASPSRRPPEVLDDLAAGRVSPVYLLLGDDETGKQPLIEALCALVEPDLQPLNVERFHATDPRSSPQASGADAIERAVAAARTFPMLGDRRIVFLMRADAVLKRARARTTEDVDDEGLSPPGGDGADEDAGSCLALLDEYLKAPAAHACLVVVASDLNRGTRIGRALLQGATVVEFWGLREGKDARGPQLGAALDAAERYVRQRVGSAGKAIAAAAIERLVEYAGTDIGLLRGAVERVLLYCGERSEVTGDDVRAVVSGEASVDQWALTNAIGDGDAREALRQLRLALEAGVSPYLVLGQIGWFVRARLPGIAPGRVAEAVGHQFAFDFAMKTSGGDPQVLLERLVVELCGRAAGSTRRLRRG